MPLTVDELLDREIIRDKLADYSVSSEIGQSPDLKVAVFHVDAVLELSDGEEHRGREAIKTLFDEISRERGAAAGPNGFGRHWIYPFRFDFTSSSEAATVSYMLAFSERGFEQVVTYYDQWLKDDGTWHITRRRIGMEYLADDSRFKLANSDIKSRR
jgi:hypothetical protein